MAFHSSLNDCNGKYDNTRKDIVHQHMLAHYRRLYSAKCGIDNSTPAHFKPRYKPKARPVQIAVPIAEVPKNLELSSKDLKFLKSLAGEVRTWWNQSSSRPSVHHCGGKNNMDRVKHTSKITAATENYLKRDLNYKKGALANGASSKLREMSVYHPPRRRVMTAALNKHCGHYSSKSNKKVYHEKAGEDISATSKLFANEISTVIEEQNEELLYLRFVQDITQDILSHEVYSNEKVLIMFKKHLTLNRDKLDMGKMLKEIETLGTRIGLPPYNYSSLYCPKKPLINDEARQLNNCGNISTEVKKSYSLTFSNKSKLNDFAPSVSSSLSENKVDLIKQGEVFERQRENNIFGFLEEMSFDSNNAEEINALMTDTDFTEYQFMSNNAKIPTNILELVSTGEIENYKSKIEKHHSKNVTVLPQYNDTNIIFGNNRKKTSNFVHDKTLEMERILESIHDSDIAENIVENIEEISTAVPFKNTESERSERSETELIKKCVKNENAKNNSSEQNNKVNRDICSDVVASPMGSDYSSMKDHDDSIYDDYSEDERDEGQGSGSEIAEEIPEDLSQSSISSGISQITEKLKGFSVDRNTLLHSQTNETKKASSENNTHSLRERVL